MHAACVQFLEFPDRFKVPLKHLQVANLGHPLAIFSLWEVTLRFCSIFLVTDLPPSQYVNRKKLIFLPVSLTFWYDLVSAISLDLFLYPLSPLLACLEAFSTFSAKATCLLVFPSHQRVVVLNVQACNRSSYQKDSSYHPSFFDNLAWALVLLVFGVRARQACLVLLNLQEQHESESCLRVTIARSYCAEML